MLDIATAAQWARSPEIARTYGIDPKSILLSGHSMGGSSALNAARQLPWLKGVIAIAPYDISRLFAEPPYGIDFLMEIGAGVLREKTPGAIRQNAIEHQAALSLCHAADDLREQNLLLIGGSRDDIAPPEQMIAPLWTDLQAQKTDAVQTYIQLPSDHDFCSFRIALIEQIGNWIADLFE